MKAFKIAILTAATVVLVAGCNKGTTTAASDEKPQLHKDVPPHGGTPVAIGDDYNIELVCDNKTGILSGYVLDDEMEEFIRSSAPSITIVARVGGVDRTLVLEAVANTATGETVGNTSLFEGRADWLKTTPNFDGVLKSIAIRGTTFTDVKFHFPNGNADN